MVSERPYGNATYSDEAVFTAEITSCSAQSPCALLVKNSEEAEFGTWPSIFTFVSIPKGCLATSDAILFAYCIDFYSAIFLSCVTMPKYIP